MKRMFRATVWAIVLTMALWIGTAQAYPTNPITEAPVIVADSGDAPASTSVSTTTEPDDTISTAEIKMPVEPPTPNELPGLVTELIQLIKNKSWPAAIALAIVILMGVLKLDFIGNLLGKYVPKRLMPLLPIGLGVFAGAIQGWVAGGWQQAAQVVVESGVLAIAFHQIWSHAIVRKKE